MGDMMGDMINVSDGEEVTPVGEMYQAMLDASRNSGDDRKSPLESPQEHMKYRILMTAMLGALGAGFYEGIKNGY